MLYLMKWLSYEKVGDYNLLSLHVCISQMTSCKIELKFAITDTIGQPAQYTGHV